MFCEVAYKANQRQDLVDGVDEFIDDLIVLPPSIWDPSNRLDPPEQTISMVRYFLNVEKNTKNCEKYCKMIGIYLAEF